MQDDDDPWFGASAEKAKFWFFNPLLGGFDEKTEGEQLAKCRQKIVACFNEVKNEFGECGVREAWELFDAFVRSPVFRPKKKKKGPHDPQYDRAVLAAYDAAPRGQKEKAAFAVPRKKPISQESFKRHLSRLRKARKDHARRFEVFEKDQKRSGVG